MKTNYFVVAGIAAVVSLLVSLFLLKPVEKVVNVGALSSPDFASPYFSFGGVRSWAGSESLQSGTTTLCAIQAPAATTTLAAASVRIDFASTSAAYIELGNATTAFATTTSLGKTTVLANAQGAMAATSSVTALLPDGVVPPNSWINVKASFATAASAATVPQGRCNVVFREI